ncbi:hypothetical protein GCM10010289_07730 [Streptomyces violascens]|uniref:Uncharacterized protein n=1 Tax=Streptomyces violascens TaxID=67381 RepID=A0ABQ3QGR1_9ACTN|nr:hypothetical protein [Streptomyces violascens]GGT90049.1 hypothetical protein GCM10010289_07730 [Streptomyces violascens]GHI36438.1 hypothetical protein Sviol_08460 [Streptomyces violascens]
MAKTDRGDDPEPCERTPAGPLFVPVRPGPAGCAARRFRTPLGDRTAVGFTTRSWRVRDVSVTGAAVVADALALWIG